MMVLLTVTAIIVCLAVCALCTWGIVSMLCMAAEQLKETMDKLKKE